MKVIEVSHSGDVSAARQEAKSMAAEIGFDDQASEEIALAVSELASNLVKHARGGGLTLTPLATSGRVGLRIVSQDRGPGIADVEKAMADGFSTAGGLGCGLGTVNRLMDTLDITSQRGLGTTIVCQRWVRLDAPSPNPCPLDFGIATRPRPGMEVNGDAFVIQRWCESALVGVIDGLGHGPLAHLAAETARQYVETHFDQPLDAIFRGVGRVCHATRGVVMALARFDWAKSHLTFASIGNIEVRAFVGSQPLNFIVRRGVLGGNAPNAVITEHPWDVSCMMVLHSDGLTTRWRWEDFPDLLRASATAGSWMLLRALAKDEDDATVIVVKGAEGAMRDER